MLALINIAKLGRETAEAAKRVAETSPEFLLKRIAELERDGTGSGNLERASWRGYSRKSNA